MERVVVNCESLDFQDAGLLFKYVRHRPEVEQAHPHTPPGTYEKRGGVYNSTSLQQFVILFTPVAAYAGKKAIDIAADVVKQWFLERSKRCAHRTVPLYGADGEVKKIVECDIKHPRA